LNSKHDFTIPHSQSNTVQSCWMTPSHSAESTATAATAAIESADGTTNASVALETDNVRTPQYLRMLLWLLVSVSFFEGYDGAILSLLLSDVQASFRASEALLGVIRIPIEFGLVVAFMVTNLADRIGRRKLLLLSVVGYTCFTAVTAFSWDIWSFAFAQFGSRVFLGAEYAVALTMIAEEYPAKTRGRALGTLTTLEAFGAILVALLLGATLNETSLGWRAFFLIGLGPLLILGVVRRRIKETRRFELLVERRAAGLEPPKQSLLEVWRPGFRKNLVLIGVIHLLRSLPLFSTTAWWAYFAERERGYTSLRVAITIIVAYGVGCGGYYLCGRMMDRFGRRPTAIGYLLGSVVFAILEFQTTNSTIGFVALAFAVAFGLGSRPVLSAWVAELFPTSVRSQAASYVRNLFEVSGVVFGPALAGILGDHQHGAIGNIGDTVSLLVLFQLPAVYLVWRHLPETNGANLDVIDRTELEAMGPRPSRRSMAMVAAGVLGIIGALGVFVANLSTDTSRPEGVTERWLVAVSETGRRGLHDDALARAWKLGAHGQEGSVTSKTPPKNRNLFVSIEVGNREKRGVPFSLVRRVGEDNTEMVRGFATVGFTCQGQPGFFDRPTVCNVTLDRTAKVPSNGGVPSAKAPLWLWLTALFTACSFGPIISALISRMKSTSLEFSHPIRK
jgi:MFS transporter, putative metabolite:H+ symporter